MTEARKRSLDQIVDEAQTLPPGDRLRYIRDACASDEALYASAVEDLQAREQWFADGESLVDRDLPPDPTGRTIGPYRLVRSLGQGGMGEVFLAERADEQFRQHVAIKLVRRGLLSKHIEGRLRQERQILASLDHPNIARLYDGGTTSDGTPYIVMEYVDGEPIDAYCDKRRLTIEQRLRLFMTVCSAVHRAHQNLIVHRDLKPSNILVTPDGAPKLLDFGIAKLLDERQVMHTLAVTQADYRVMTPDHASPEQIRGDSITTASDIYVLGVLLYELLSGCKPMLLKGNRLADLERAICEVAPPPLNSVTASNTDALDVADRRSTSVAKLRRELSGDLDNIVMMALRKEAERRYSSVEQFAADIERFLTGLPVLARADSWNYRAGKFVRRHTLAVSLSAAFVLSLIGFSGAIYMQSQRIRAERDIARLERERAENERVRAKTASDTLIGAFTLTDPFSEEGSGTHVTAKEILDTLAGRVTRDLRDQPLLRADMLSTMGTAYLGLGLPDQARAPIEQALSVRRSLFGTNSVEVADSLYSLSRVHEKKGDLGKAEAAARESLDINRRLTGEGSVETAGSLCRLGVIKQEQGQFRDAEQLFDACLKIRVARLGEHHADVTIPLDNLAVIAWLRNDNVTAEKLLRRALEIDRHRPRGEEDPQSFRHLLRLAMVTYDKGDVVGAEPLFRRSLDLFRKVLGAEHPESLDAMSSFGSFLTETGRLDEAQPLLRDVLEIDRRRRGAEHAYVGVDLTNLAQLAFRRGQYAQAEQYCRDALHIFRLKNLRPSHDFIAGTLTVQGRALLELGRLAAAETALRQAVDGWRLEYGDKSSAYAVARASLARTWALQKRYADAEPAFLESYPVLARSARIADKEIAGVVRRWIEDLYRAMGKPDAAQKFFEQQRPAA
jgi:serine/threonine protein kinase/Tfp pilus assembly protein PilF